MQPLALVFLELLVVGHLFDQLGYTLTEFFHQNGAGHLLILNRIVEQRCNDEFGIFTIGCFSYKVATSSK